MAQDLDIQDNAQQQQGSDFGGYEELVTLDPREHIRLRPGMYIGKLGDGSQSDDGIYVLMKEVIDNSIDEFNTGFAKPRIDITVDGGKVTIRDYGRGIPLNQVKDASSKMNTGAKYDTKNYKRSVGLNGVGIKAVNALSSSFYVESTRDGVSSYALFRRGELQDSGKRDQVVYVHPTPTVFHVGDRHSGDRSTPLGETAGHLGSGQAAQLSDTPNVRGDL